MKNINLPFDIAALSTRLSLSIVVLAHGLQKAFGWFGGYGFDGTVGFFTQSIGIPYFAAVLIILLETVGMVALLLGIFGRYVAAALIPVMLGAIFFTHLQNGFFMNWSGAQQAEGFEFHILVIGLSIVVLLNGTGAYSLDRLLFGKRSGDIKLTA